MSKAKLERIDLKTDDEVVYCADRSCRIAAAIARLGNATDADISEALNINLSTFRLWKGTHPEFAQALKTPTGCNIGAVVRAEVRHALGFSYKTDKVIDTREGGVVRSVTIIVPPNVEALEFLLRARMPAVYGPKAAESSNRLYEALNEALARFDVRQKRPASAVATEELLDDEICRVAHVMARLCASDDEIAEALGLSVDSFNQLRDRHVELSEALKSGKEFVDRALERALGQRASGYHYEGEEIICTREGDVVRMRVLRHAPPDIKALEHWLHAHPGP